MCNSPITTIDGKQYPCGRCQKCHNRYIQHWTFRLQHEMRVTNRMLFLTLTYDYNHVPMSKKGKMTLDNENAISLYKKQNPPPPRKPRKDGKPPIYSNDYQKYFKRLRNALPDRRIKYVLCGEYGSERGRPHYHAILFGVDSDDFNIVNRCWGMGQIHIGSVTPASIAYVFKYSVKASTKPLHYSQLKPFITMSKGLGETFAFDIYYEKQQYHTKNGTTLTRNKKVRIPKPHFQNKLSTLLDMPYYQLPSQKGGVVKMSIPRFYLDAANYDKTELTELYLDKMQTKYDHHYEGHKNYISQLEQIQTIGSVNSWTAQKNFTVSKESKDL